ncbi:coiled-coil domain-containing protein [Spirosoma fluviale]|uniref:Uncharacterized protein n=1 Tax=Spirosoma fluviale TaxID=1597977 RepID=A0A286GHY9_9BACT|nr:hypothetical protein [Spirosoma fluviale]SOD94836.1 hypothetical protein SAMN06269250_4656 [Spirosoma fluviale]
MAQRNNLLTGVLAMLTALLVAFGFYYWQSTQTLRKENDLNEQRADSLFSAKLRLEGDLRSLESQLETAADENEWLNERLTAVHEQVASRNQQLNGLRQRTASTGNTIRQLHQNVSTLTVLRDSLENQMEAIRDKLNWLTNSNNLLLSQNKELQQQVNTLNSSLLTKVSESAVTGDAFLVVATKTNRKETAKAKKVHTLTISLDIPAELRLEGSQDVYLSLTDNQQNAVPEPLRDMTVSLADVNEVIPVHAVQKVNFSLKPQRILFSLSPAGTLKPGSYRAAVFTKNAYLGAVTFQFRDSFLFF